MTLTLNADVGEVPARVYGEEAALIALLDEANIACGGHAGDVDTMRLTVARCLAHDVVIGAHPSYPDREGFGRRRLSPDDDALRQSLIAQVRALADVAAAAGTRLSFLKPHGALYHAVDDDPATAAVLADVVDDLAPVVGARLPVVLLHARGVDTPSRRLLRARDVVVRGEVFADRGTDAQGQPGAELDLEGATATVRQFASHGGASTVCIHGDGPHALAMAEAVRAVLGPRKRAKL
jgi:UPF0271 protein